MKSKLSVHNNQNTGRLYFLDNLKIFLIVLVIFHHTGQAYGPTGGFWQYKSSLHESVIWLGRFFGVNAAFFMGLFFLISGYFFPGSYERKGGKEFIKDKLLRFGIPLLFALLIMQPLEMFFYYINYSGNHPLSFSDYYFKIFFGIGGMPEWFKPSIGFPEMNFGHLWFVEHLLVYSILYFLLRSLLRESFTLKFKTNPLIMITVITLLIIIITVIVRIWYPIDRWTGLLGFIQSEPAHLPQYFLMFTTGIIAYRNDWITKISENSGRVFLTIGLLLSSIVWVSLMLPDSLIRIIWKSWPVYESILAVTVSWGLITFFRKRFNFTNKFLDNIASATYAVYIFHFPVVLFFQYSLDKVQIGGALGKFMIVATLSVITTFFISWTIKKIPGISRIL